MSYLHLPSINMSDFAKGTISFWFRFSQDSVDKAAAYVSKPLPPQGPQILDSTMPFVTFGRKVMAHAYDNEVKTFVQDTPFGRLERNVPHTVFVGDGPCPPSHIGILCGETPSLVMYFQMNSRALVQGIVHQVSDIHWDIVVIGSGGSITEKTVVEDISYVRVATPESFLVVPDFSVDVDKWHHLLVSFDFSTSVDVMAAEVPPEPFGGNEEAIRSMTIKSYCKIWYAFDDENKKGKNNIGDNTGGKTPTGWVPQHENGIIPQNAESAISVYTPQPPNPDIIGGIENPEYHWVASPLPMNDGPVGLPASAEYVETIYHCEMAEFQFFADLVLDTGDVSKRRAFVDNDGKPVPPPKTEEILGRRPNILLHNSTNWQAGNNTGSTGLSGGDEIIASGQFTPVAGINTYRPDPVLGTL